MTQPQLIIEYIKEFGSILPAKCYGKIYKGQMLGSELSRRCRDLRKTGVLDSEAEGKFERFWIKGQKPVIQAITGTMFYTQASWNNKYCCPSIACGFETHNKDCISLAKVPTGQLF